MDRPATRQKILVVDDEPDIVEIVQTNLEGSGFQVVTAKNGAQALQKVKAENPDLVILDVLMPELDGWDVLRAIESDSQTAGLPVIMLTSKTEDADILRGLVEGAVEYFTKPFYPENLVASAKILLDVFDRRLREERRQHLIAQRQRLMGMNPASITAGPSDGF
jgi:two-component system, OmpR family, alkaline phosphatase synthesis response regulator PhoP